MKHKRTLERPAYSLFGLFVNFSYKKSYNNGLSCFDRMVGRYLKLKSILELEVGRNNIKISGLYYKHITIVNDNSRVISK